MTLKPIAGIAKNIVIIFVIATATTIMNAYFGGTPPAWKEFPHLLGNGIRFGIGLACAWVAMESPWSRQFRTLVGSFVTTGPSGEPQETTLKATVPAAESTGTTTMTLDPHTQQLTIKEEAVKPSGE
jgi:hypothetical protein